MVALVAGGAFFLTSGDDDSSDEPGSEEASTGGAEGEGEETPESTTTTTTVDNSEDILAAANAAYTAFAEADCETLEALLLPEASPPASCQMVANSMGLTIEFTDVELASQTEDQAFVDHTLILDEETAPAPESLQGTTELVLQDGQWLIANFTGNDSPDGPPANAPELGEPTAPPTGGESSFHDELAQNCHDGNMFDCDYLADMGDLWLPEDQAHKDYGSTCGGRLAEPTNGMCDDWYGSEI